MASPPDHRSGSGSGNVGRVLGIDAAGRHGWVGVVIDPGGYRRARLGSIREIIDWAEPVAAIGIDIPVGLVDTGYRQADVEARRFVMPLWQSVFMAPPAGVLDARSYGDANSELARRGEPRISRQAWALVPRIEEAAEVADADARVHEVHPEVSFRTLAGHGLECSKKTWNGLSLRRRLLESAGIRLPDELAGAGGAAPDDVVDAAVAAWSAQRIAAGTAGSLPVSDRPQKGTGGRDIAIWY